MFAKFKQINMVLILTLVLLLSTNNVAQSEVQIPAIESTTTLIQVYQTPNTAKIAVLESDDTDTTFWNGGNSNSFQEYTDGLNNDSFDATVLNNSQIINGFLDEYDVLVMPDNAPNQTAAEVVKQWWIAGGELLIIDSAISYLIGYELLGGEFNQTREIDGYNETGGYNYFWDYNAPFQGGVIDPTYPVMNGYTFNQTINGISGNAEFNRSLMLSSSIGDFYHPLIESSCDYYDYESDCYYGEGGGEPLGLDQLTYPYDIGFDLMSAIDLPNRGRIVYTWDYSSYDYNNNTQLVNNSITWLIGDDVIPSFPEGQVLPNNVEIETGNYDLSFKVLDDNPTYYTINITLDGSSLVNLSDSYENDELITYSLDVSQEGVYGIIFTAYDLHGHSVEHTFTVTVQDIVTTTDDPTTTTSPTSTEEQTPTDEPSTSDEPTTDENTTTPNESNDETESDTGTNPLPGFELLIVGFIITMVPVLRKRNRN